jgi:putative endopeptidase
MDVSRREAVLGLLAGGSALGWAAGAALADVPDPQRLGAPGLDLGQVDASVAPGDDFFRYVNGGWLRTATIPPDQGRNSEFGRLDELNSRRNRDLLEAAARTAAGPESRKLGDLYASLMDEAAIERAGAAPLKAELDRIAAVSDAQGLARALAQLARDALPGLPGGSSAMAPGAIGASVQVDDKTPSRYVATLSQGGIGLPDRDYYLVDNEAFAKARAAYKAHLRAMFALAGMDQAEARAEGVYGLEERLARSHWSREAQRDADKRYNPMSRAALVASAPGLDWNAYLEAAGFGRETDFVVTAPSAVAGAAQAASAVPLNVWKDYLAYRVIQTFAPAAPRAFVDETFAFEDKALQGADAPPPRWRRVGALVDRSMGHAVGRLYMAAYFPPAAQAQARAMAGQVKAAMGRRINALAWMTPATKARALEKLAAVRIEVGGQEPLRTYEGLEVRRDAPYANLLAAARFAYGLNLARLGKPVNRGEWQMVPQTVNAQANARLVKIMFPAGIMQGLFFNPAADPAVNYGAIGVVMGHELSHEFDDQGSKYDAAGRLQNWWASEDRAAFDKATAALAEQYGAYEPLPGAHINGRLTLGENIGDLAGLSVALDAYHASLAGRPAPVISGLSGDQRFFMAYATVWRTLSREPYMRRALTTDPHSPGEWRAAEVRNLDAWYDAFSVKPGQRMYLPPEQRVRIW